MTSERGGERLGAEVVTIRRGLPLRDALIGELTLIAGGVGAIWGSLHEAPGVRAPVIGVGILFLAGALFYPVTFVYWRSRARGVVLYKRGIEIGGIRHGERLRIRWEDVIDCDIWETDRAGYPPRIVALTCRDRENAVILGVDFEIPLEEVVRLVLARIPPEPRRSRVPRLTYWVWPSAGDRSIRELESGERLFESPTLRLPMSLYLAAGHDTHRLGSDAAEDDEETA